MLSTQSSRYWYSGLCRRVLVPIVGKQLLLTLSGNNQSPCWSVRSKALMSLLIWSTATNTNIMFTAWDHEKQGEDHVPNPSLRSTFFVRIHLSLHTSAYVTAQGEFDVSSQHSDDNFGTASIKQLHVQMLWSPQRLSMSKTCKFLSLNYFVWHCHFARVAYFHLHADGWDISKSSHAQILRQFWKTE